uniref:N-acetylgalactosaminide beta-1,3-galactosyltransferase n=1 Tax=Blastobotrys adeninivorans TaxID=409370 RepID=A0A060T9M0_BLAAD
MVIVYRVHKRRVLNLASVLVLSAVVLYLVPRLPRRKSPLPYQQPAHSYFHTYPDSNRYIGEDIWRPPPDRLGPAVVVNRGQQSDSPVKFRQPIAQDYPENADKVMIMIKTGENTMWDRLPIHFLTTLTRFPNFAIYSDSAGSIGGYEVIDILDHAPDDVLMSDNFEMYRQMLASRKDHSMPWQSDADLGRGWTLDKYKNILMLYHTYKSAPELDWYVMIDDDTALLADNLMAFLAIMNPAMPLYTGSAVAGLEHIFAHGGSGIVLSNEILRKVFDRDDADELVANYTRRAHDECCGDYMIAVFLREVIDYEMDFRAPHARFQGEALWDVPAGPINWCQPIVTLHHVTPREHEIMWEYERIKKDRGIVGGEILYRDLYNDFFKPYLGRQLRQGWDNGAKEVEFSLFTDTDPDSDADSKPYASVDKCILECNGRADCLMLRYDDYRQYCGLSTSVSYGRPIKDYREYDDHVHELRVEKGLEAGRRDDQKMVSLWYIERIRSMRAAQWCDVLHKDRQAEGKENGPYDQTEGWWHRAQHRYKINVRQNLVH